MNLIKDTNINFMGYRKFCYILSLVILLVGIVSLVMHGGIRYNIDFTGGLLIQAELKNADVSQVRQSLANAGYTDAEIQQVKGTENFIIKTVSKDNASDKVKAALRKDFPEAAKGNFIIQEEEVGPKAGAELRSQALIAVLISVFFILLYIWFRFKFTWGIAAAISLFHDVIIVLGLLSVFNVEMSMNVLAAMLTIVGYSINDTIVVFDRIREDLKLYRKDDEFSLFNRAINETLSRTIITGISTILADVALMIWGGPVIHDFAFTLFIGLIIGTYSSVFIASAVVLDAVLVYRKKNPKK
jgi:preprotein translocase subunit SecF